jgi:hypothetical protein
MNDTINRSNNRSSKKNACKQKKYLPAEKICVKAYLMLDPPCPPGRGSKNFLHFKHPFNPSL